MLAVIVCVAVNKIMCACHCLQVTDDKTKLHSQLSALTCKLCEEEKNKEKLLLQHILQGKVYKSIA